MTLRYLVDLNVCSIHRRLRWLAWNTFWVSIFSLLLSSTPGFAASPAEPNFAKEPNTGIQFPKETVFNHRTYQWVHFDTINTKIMGIPTYTAAIGFYLEKGEYTTSASIKEQLLKKPVPKLMIFAFVRTVTAATLAETWGNAVREYIPDPTKPDIQRDIYTLEQALEDVQRGSFIQFCWLPDGTLEMMIGKKTKAKIKNATVSEALWAVHYRNSTKISPQ